MWYVGLLVTLVDLLNPASAGLSSVKRSPLWRALPLNELLRRCHDGASALGCPSRSTILTGGIFLQTSGGVVSVGRGGGSTSGDEPDSGIFSSSDSVSGIGISSVLGSGLTTCTCTCTFSCGSAFLLDALASSFQRGCGLILGLKALDDLLNVALGNCANRGTLASVLGRSSRRVSD